MLAIVVLEVHAARASVTTVRSPKTRLPALVTCRKGPRSSALVYLYAGLRDGTAAEDVLRQAEEDGAPFAQSDELKAWVRRGLQELS
ncbi:MAG TPA: hypothetical protein VF066_00520 [Thermoleophilaceae bacterium]